jgi:hypothetical protein
MGRLLRGTFAMILYFCLATLIAQAIVVGYLVSKWKLDGSKAARMIAAAQGRDRPAAVTPAAAPPAAPAEQSSFDQVLEARAVRDKNLQLRELALNDAIAQLRTDKLRFEGDRNQLDTDRTTFEKRLDKIASGAKSAGREELVQILQGVKPKQAKEFLSQMLDKKETEEVVMLLSMLSDTKCAKILGEFKTADETKKIEEVLQMIRDGVPEAPAAKQAKDQLGKKSSPAAKGP